MPRFLLHLITSAALLGAPVLHAQDAPPRAATGEIPRAATAVINTTMSPYCPGLLLANCPSPSADSLRKALVDRAARGASESELRAELTRIYGDAVSAAPTMTGLGAVAWIAPFALLLGVGLLVALWMRRQRVGAETHAPVSPIMAVDPADAERMERLQRMVHGNS